MNLNVTLRTLITLLVSKCGKFCVISIVCAMFPCFADVGRKVYEYAVAASGQFNMHAEQIFHIKLFDTFMAKRRTKLQRNITYCGYIT
jgi:hypothetical protein